MFDVCSFGADIYSVDARLGLLLSMQSEANAAKSRKFGCPKWHGLHKNKFPRVQRTNLMHVKQSKPHFAKWFQHVSDGPTLSRTRSS